MFKKSGEAEHACTVWKVSWMVTKSFTELSERTDHKVKGKVQHFEYARGANGWEKASKKNPVNKIFVSSLRYYNHYYHIISYLSTSMCSGGVVHKLIWAYGSSAPQRLLSGVIHTGLSDEALVLRCRKCWRSLVYSWSIDRPKTIQWNNNNHSRYRTCHAGSLNRKTRGALICAKEGQPIRGGKVWCSNERCRGRGRRSLTSWDNQETVENTHREKKVTPFPVCRTWTITRWGETKDGIGGGA